MTETVSSTSEKPTSIRLYTQSRNPYSERVAAALALKGLPFERVISDDPDDVARWSPIARTLPVLEIDGRRKADSAVILEWIEEVAPEPALLSTVPKTAAAQQQLADWSNNSFTFYWNRWRTARFPQPGDDQPVDASLIVRVLDHVGRRLGRPPRTRADARELEIVSQLFDRLTDLEGFLGDRAFFYADEPSIADISVYAMLRVLRDGPIPGCAEAIEERAPLASFIERMERRIAAAESRRLGVET
ncbi:MAG: glutathione S-transferase family protein [Myxococcota bacterium]